MVENFEEIKSKFVNAGQEHVFKYWDTLTNDEQCKFLQQLSKIDDPSLFMRDVTDAILYSSSVSGSKEYTQLPASSFQSTISCEREQLAKWVKWELYLWLVVKAQD